MERVGAGTAGKITLLFLLSASPLHAQNLGCEDYNTVMSIFENQGTYYRGVTYGPNHRLVEIYENEATNKGIAVLYDSLNDQACMVAMGFNYDAFANRSDIDYSTTYKRRGYLPQ